jgi:hypothetical protein
MISASRKIDHQSQSANPAPIVVFRERCEARAMLIANGLMTLQESVDELQEAAVLQGLVATHGQDEIQRIMSESFARWR